MEHTGRITKGIGSFYTLLDGGKEYVCKARGKFRIDGETPLPGDMASFELNDDGKGYIKEILPRKNRLVRPAVANLDKLFIVISAALPKPDYSMIDKLLVQCSMIGVHPVLIVNKCDDAVEGQVEDIRSQYCPAGYTIIMASARTGAGVDNIRMEICGNICCMAGQSAVGKSSLMNAILPGLRLEVGELSEKAGRGKHTTRHAELWPAWGGAVVDTPGFSLLDMAELEPEELSEHYPEMKGRRQLCRFPGCLHISEPDCVVKPVVGHEISYDRYARYVEFANQLKEKRKHRYD